MVNWWFGIRFGVPLSNNPFHRGISGIQTTNPNQQSTICWLYDCGEIIPRSSFFFIPVTHLFSAICRGYFTPFMHKMLGKSSKTTSSPQKKWCFFFMLMNPRLESLKRTHLQQIHKDQRVLYSTMIIISYSAKGWSQRPATTCLVDWTGTGHF